MLTGPDEWGVDRPLALAPWKGATLWQWTDHGHSPGIAGDLDLDRSVVADKRVRALAKQPESPWVLRWVPAQHVDKGLIATHVAGEHDVKRGSAPSGRECGA